MFSFNAVLLIKYNTVLPYMASHILTHLVLRSLGNVVGLLLF